MSQAGSYITASDGILVIHGNSGSAIPVAGAVSVIGSGSITTTGSGSTLTISSTGGFAWTDETASSVTMSPNQGYISNRGTLITFTLPAVAAEGSFIAIVGKGAGGWSIAQNAGQTIHVIGLSTTTGVGGSLSSTVQYDCIELLCTTANTDFVARSLMGNLTIV